ncbi:LysM peptidoglycan-binding domain-containing protein [Bifidobacterium sp. M3-N-101]|nr:LysM domain-containing protein [Bifidobacterium breve]MCM0689938.1 LysM peptidoglycan-binding domain-containing protein [Bifidobacterium sp. M3-N-101]
MRSGDTLSSIAARLGIQWTQLHGYRSGNPNFIYPGEVLTY